MIGLSTRGSISLGCAFVAGRNRVPNPAAGNMALRTRMVIGCRFASALWCARNRTTIVNAQLADCESRRQVAAILPSCVVNFSEVFLPSGEPRLIELAPSILSADFSRLGEQVRAAGEGGGTVIHVDVMDGHFVPNITIGPPVVRSLRKVTELTLDCHLMIENPDQYIPEFVEAGADWISIHQEACRHLNRSLHLIRSHGARPGVVINPATPVDTLTEVLDIVDYVLVMSVNPGFGGQKFIPNTLRKLRQLSDIRGRRGLNFHLEVDGGIGLETVSDAVRSGGEILVAGNAVFGKGDPKTNAEKLLKTAQDAMMLKV